MIFEYPGNGRVGQKKQLIFEQRIWSPYVQEGYENGNAFYGTKGFLVMGHTVGWQLFGERNKLIDSMTGKPNLPAHHRNFLDCIQTGQRPHADVEIGHLGASLCHLGNIATRVGRLLTFDPQQEKIVGDEEAELRWCVGNIANTGGRRKMSSAMRLRWRYQSICRMRYAHPSPFDAQCPPANNRRASGYASHSA